MLHGAITNYGYVSILEALFKMADVSLNRPYSINLNVQHIDFNVNCSLITRHFQGLLTLTVYKRQ